MSNTSHIPADFPYSSGNQVGQDYTVNGITLEPSGLAVSGNTIYMASDNGYVLSYDLTTNLTTDNWSIAHNFTNDTAYQGDSNSYDLESVAYINSSLLMLGVEGTSSDSNNKNHQYDPHIISFNPTSNSIGTIWDITDVTLGSAGGMEAMTFVPISGGCPNYGADTQNSNYTPDYLGYFFAAYQSKTGFVYVYDLKNSDLTVGSHLYRFPLAWVDGTGITMEASDMCYADGHLFVLFDGGGLQDELHVFTLNSDKSGLTHVGATYLPTSNTSCPDFSYDGNDYEGITISGSNLYLSIDGHTDTKKQVLQYTNFSVSDFISDATS